MVFFLPTAPNLEHEANFVSFFAALILQTLPRLVKSGVSYFASVDFVQLKTNKLV